MPELATGKQPSSSKREFSIYLRAGSKRFQFFDFERASISYPSDLFYKSTLRTPAVSSTNFGSILIVASCVVGTCNILDYMGEFFLYVRGPIILLKYI